MEFSNSGRTRLSALLSMLLAFVLWAAIANLSSFAQSLPPAVAHNAADDQFESRTGQDYKGDSREPQITWSKAVIKRIVIPGQTGFEYITFLINHNEHDMDVIVSPGLLPFVRPSPRQFKQIKEGVSYSLRLDIAVPPTVPIGAILEGQIQFRADDDLLSVPLLIKLGVEAASSRNSDPDKIVQDEFASYPTNEVVVTLSPGSTLGDAQRFALNINGTVVGAIPEIDTYQLLVNTKTAAALKDLVAMLRANPPINLLGVTPNYISVAPSSASTDLENLAGCLNGTAKTTAYSSVHTVGAWELMRLMNPLAIPRSTTIGLLDTGVQTVIGMTALGAVFHPEFSVPPVNFGKTPPESMIDSHLLGHGTEVAGIVGANNGSDPSLGLNYQCPGMNGIITGVPNILGKYTLEERAGPDTTITTQLANTVSSITSGARIILLEMLITAKARLTTEQMIAGKLLCDFAAVDKIEDLEIDYLRWSNMFKVNPEVLFVLPAGNYGQRLPQLLSASQFSDVVSIVGGINRDNTITVGAYDPRESETSMNYRAVWGVTPSGVVCQASNFGPGVDIAAPGSHVFAPKPTDLDHLSANYFYTDSFNGTSASAPFVAGAAAMLYAVDPALPGVASMVPLHIKNTLIASADPLSPDLGLGGRLNICRAVKNTLGLSFTITGSSPADQQLNVPLVTSEIDVNLSLPLAESGALAPNINVSANGQLVAGSVTVSPDRKTIQFFPSAFLLPGTVYVVDASRLQDLCGDYLNATRSFRTALPPPNLSIIKTANPTTVTSGGAVTFNITVQNASGTQDAQNVIISDPFVGGFPFVSCTVSQGSCSNATGTPTAIIGTLASGANSAFSIITTAPNVSALTTFANTAYVTASNAIAQRSSITFAINPAPQQQPTWTQKFPTVSPSPRFTRTMTYDETRNQTVLLGSNSGTNETWLWDGGNWIESFPVSTPPARFDAAMVFDQAHGEVVLFGGQLLSSNERLSDTWVWDGSNWAQRFPVTSPAPRSGHAMAYDAARRQVVLFGGVSTGGFSTFNETWVWDGSNWIRKFPSTSPPARSLTAMIYDTKRDQILLFGGFPDVFSGAIGAIDDTWIWDGLTWTQKSLARSPSARYYHVLVYDVSTNQSVLFGGVHDMGGDPLPPILNDTWIWDGSNWIQMSPATSPPVRDAAGASYDSVRAQIVLFGGFNYDGLRADTWVWPVP